MGGLIVLAVAWIIIGIVVGVLGGMVVRSNPPYGLGVQIGACVVVALLFGGGAWLEGGWMGIGGVGRLVYAFSLSTIGAVATPWFLRWWKRRRSSSQGEV